MNSKAYRDANLKYFAIKSKIDLNLVGLHKYYQVVWK